MATPSHSTTTAALPPGTPASPLAPRFPVWRFLLALGGLPPLLAIMAAASWLAWMCFRGVMGPPSASSCWPALRLWQPSYDGTRASKSAWRCALIALVGLVAVVWVVFALLAVALVGWVTGH